MLFANWEMIIWNVFWLIEIWVIFDKLFSLGLLIKTKGLIYVWFLFGLYDLFSPSVLIIFFIYIQCLWGVLIIFINRTHLCVFWARNLITGTLLQARYFRIFLLKFLWYIVFNTHIIFFIIFCQIKLKNLLLFSSYLFIQGHSFDIF